MSIPSDVCWAVTAISIMGGGYIATRRGAADDRFLERWTAALILWGLAVTSICCSLQAKSWHLVSASEQKAIIQIGPLVVIVWLIAIIWAGVYRRGRPAILAPRPGTYEILGLVRDRRKYYAIIRLFLYRHIGEQIDSDVYTPVLVPLPSDIPEVQLNQAEPGWFLNISGDRYMLFEVVSQSA